MRAIGPIFIVILLLAAAYVVLRPAPPLPLPDSGVKISTANESPPAPKPEQAPGPAPSMPEPANVPAPAAEPAPSAAPSAEPSDAPPESGAAAGSHRRQLRLASRRVEGVTVRNRDGQVVFHGTVDLAPTLERIELHKPKQFAEDGNVFENREGRLPAQPRGYYREYVHPTPRLYGPGPQRVVIGAGGEVYYTADHYRTFSRL